MGSFNFIGLIGGAVPSPTESADCSEFGTIRKPIGKNVFTNVDSNHFEQKQVDGGSTDLLVLNTEAFESNGGVGNPWGSNINRCLRRQLEVFYFTLVRFESRTAGDHLLFVVSG